MTTQGTTQWHTLIALAQHATDAAEQSLQTLARSVTDATAQRDVLQTYRQDYAQRIQQAASHGVSASNYHNFRRFLHTLDDAIVQQTSNISRLQAQSEQGRLQWMAHKRKLNAYQTLQQRQQARIHHANARREQRQHDELSQHRRAPLAKETA